MQNYLIIGGSSGIGLSLVKMLHEKGHNVISTYNSTEPPASLSGVTYHKLDVMSEEVDLSFLPDSLDGLAYCPGSINLAPFARIKPDAFVRDYELNVAGAVKVLQSALSALKKSDQASVLLFSTVAVQTGFNFHSQVAASKGAVEGLTRALAAEFAPKIRVNAIAPSITDTKIASRFLNTDDKKQTNADRHPLKQIGQPEDIASLAAYLLSTEARWVTGQIYTVDGGISSLKV